MAEGSDLDVSSLILELTETGKKEGFLSPKEGGNFSSKWGSGNRHIRAYEIGEILNKNGGTKLMAEVCLKVDSLCTGYLRGSARYLEICWNGIGSWTS